jgi:hypothetical protein
MKDCRTTGRSVQLASTLMFLCTSVSQACDSELPHAEIVDTRVVETAQQTAGPKVVYRIDNFTIQVDSEYLLTALGRSASPSSGPAVAARLREEISTATVTDVSYFLALMYDSLNTRRGPGDDGNRSVDHALKAAEQELLSALSQVMESERAIVTVAHSATELRKMRLTTYRGECGTGKVFTTLSGDMILKLAEPSK